MFCSNCGSQIQDGSKFCNVCGAKQGSVSMPASETQFVPAKCTACGGQLIVDPSLQAAVCPYCNTTFIVKQAINNYNVTMTGNVNVGSATINVQGASTDNLIARANAFEAENDFKNALVYYNRVLDIDINNVEAQQGIQRVEQKKMDFAYFKAESYNLLSNNDAVEIKRDRITIIRSNDGSIQDLYFDELKNLKLEDFCLSFQYPGAWTSFMIVAENESDLKKILTFIRNAQQGIYPD